MADPLHWCGRVLNDRYRLDAVLGHGAVGVVYGAFDLKRGRTAAVKVLSEGQAGSYQSRSRFEREGLTLSRLQHPNIVEVVGYGVADEVPYLAMERLEGHTLGHLLEDAEPLPVDLALDLARQILEGLAYAHRMGVVHRDLKPGNVFLQRSENGELRVKLLDFGLAKLLAPDLSGIDSTLTQTGMVMGTPLYMAPEQATGGQVDLSADVYAAGAVLFEMLTGRPPFLADSHQELVKAHLLETAPPLASLCPDLPRVRALDALVQRAMAKDPAARFGDAGEMLAALEALPSGPAVAEPRRAVWRGRLLVLGLLVLPLLGWVSWMGLERLAAPGPHPDLLDAGRDLPPARNLWAEQGVPEPLADLYAQVSSGAGISRDDMRYVQRYARKHPQDARPYLLMAHGFANRHWRRDAVARYLRAFRVDPGARGDPDMLEDLLAIAEDEDHGGAACAAIETIYGREALLAIRKAAQRAEPGSLHAQRLTRLAGELGKRLP